MTGTNEEGSLNIVMLLLTGRATPYLHNGVIYVGDEDHYVRIFPSEKAANKSIMISFVSVQSLGSTAIRDSCKICHRPFDIGR